MKENFEIIEGKDYQGYKCYRINYQEKGGRPTEKKTYWILSGEGENGTWEKHIATLTGIKRIATKERCGGDRWAQIWEEIPETDTTEAHICNIDDGDMRDVPDED